MAIDDKTRALLDGKNFINVATMRPDGRPQVVPVWVTTDGENVIVNSALGRGWVRNVDRDPQVTMTIFNHDNPYEYSQIYGKVVDASTDGADDVIDQLAKKYLDVDSYPYRTPDEQRVTLTIEPEKVSHRG